jgi:4-amino-4-deoxy-L-arabinose transferase-like glycosyltransferase
MIAWESTTRGQVLRPSAGGSATLVLLIALLTLAFAARIAVRVALERQYFGSNGDDFSYDIAGHLAAGETPCGPAGCAFSTLLTGSVLAGHSFWLIVLPQALLGAGTALCAYLIGAQLFNRRTGVLACAITAVYPYYLMHDTALQDTVLVTFLAALSVWLLLRARRRNTNFDWLLAGVALGTLPLVRASLTLAIAVGLLWCLLWGASGRLSDRLRKSSLLALAALLILGPWLFYTYRVTGIPVISTETGLALWVGNNPDTFSHYPAASIDRSRDEAMRHLSVTDTARLAALAKDEGARSNWYMHRALAFMRANPSAALTGAVRKIAAGFSSRLNPYRERLAQAAYFVGYFPVAVLGLLGMALARKKPGTILIALLFLSFIAVTAIFWAHTRHRAYLDVYWIVFAASVLAGLRLKRRFRAKPPIAPEIESAGPGSAARRNSPSAPVFRLLPLN